MWRKLFFPRSLLRFVQKSTLLVGIERRGRERERKVVQSLHPLHYLVSLIEERMKRVKSEEERKEGGIEHALLNSSTLPSLTEARREDERSPP